MFCRNCGKEISDSVGFCPGCGTRTKKTENINEPAQIQTEQPSENFQQMNAQPSQQGNIQSIQTEGVVGMAGGEGIAVPVDAIPIKPKRKIKKLLISIAAAILGSVILVFGFFEWFGYDFFYRIFMSPEGYLAHVTEDHIVGELVKPIDDFVASFRDDGVDTANGTYSGKINLGVGTELSNILTSMGEQPVVNGEANMILDYDITKDGKKADAKFVLSMQSQKLITAQVTADMDNGVLYVSVPEYSAQAMRFEADKDDMKQAELAMSKLEAFAEALPSDDIVGDLITKYAVVAVEQIKNVKKERVDINAGGVVETQTKLTVTIDGNTIKNMALAIIEEAGDDDDIEDVLEAAGEAFGFNSKMISTQMQQALKEARSEVMDEDMSGIPAFTFVLYTNDDGNVVGFEYMDNGTGGYIKITRDFFDLGVDITIKNNNNDVVSFKGKGEVDGGGIYGEFVANIKGMDIISVKLEDVSVSDLLDGGFNGKVIIAPKDDAKKLLGLTGMNSQEVDLVSQLKIVIEGQYESAEEHSGKVGLYKGDGMIANIGYTMEYDDDDTDINIPKNSTAYSDYEMDNMLENIGESILDKIKNSGVFVNID